MDERPGASEQSGFPGAGAALDVPAPASVTAPRRRVLAAALSSAVGVSGLAAVSLSGLAACGRAAPATLAQLTAWQEAYAGQRVETDGVVREERDPDGTTYFVLSDRAGRRVGLKPRGRATPFAGRQVRVRGRFEVEPGFGRVIRIEAIGRP